MTARPVAAVFAAFALVAACSGDRPEVGVSAPGTTRRGDTIVIESSGDGVWGPAHDAVEVLRVRSDTKETTFGQIRAVTATPDGGVIVFDAKGAEGKIIRQFDSTGKFVRNIGRQGDGPGEYNTMNVKIVVSPRGEILLRDEMRAVSRYSAGGKFLSGFPLRMGSGRSGLEAAHDGSMYLPVTYAFGQSPPRGHRQAILKVDSAGRVLDSIAPGPAWLEGSDKDSTTRHAPSEQWIVLSDGRAVIARTDKVGFLLVNPRDKRASPLLADHAHTPVPFLEDERKELLANNEAAQKSYELGGERFKGDAAITIPANKQAIGLVEADGDGRVWLYVRNVSEKIPPVCVSSVSFGPGQPAQCRARVTFGERPVRAAFDLNGNYLGEVRFSIKTSFISFTGPYAWAITRDEDDVQILTKFRLYQ